MRTSSARNTATQSFIAPSASSTQKASAPIAASARVGRANAGGRSTAVRGRSRTSRGPAIATITRPTAAAPARCMSTSTPAAATRAPAAAPPSAPKENAACSVLSTGRPSRSSTDRPLRFMLTSRTPLSRPTARNAAASAPSESATAISSSVIAYPTAPSRTSGRVPVRDASAPASGWETSSPAIEQASARPICPSESPRSSRIAGSREKIEAKSAPLRAKMAVTAARTPSAVPADGG